MPLMFVSHFFGPSLTSAASWLAVPAHLVLAVSISF